MEREKHSKEIWKKRMEMDFCFRLGEWQSVSELLEEKKKKEGFVYTTKSEVRALVHAELKCI